MTVLTLGLLATACGGSDSSEQVNAGAAVSAAFDQTAEAASYVLTQSNAQTLRAEPLGIDVDTEIDPARPTVVGEFDGTSSHVVLDMGPVFGPLLGEDLDIVMEFWTDADRLVIDTQDFEQIMQAGAALGPMAPGVAFVDLSSAGADDEAFVAAVAGTGLPDLEQLARDLPAALQDVEQISTDPTIYRGTLSQAEMVEAMGGDIDDVARSIAAGLALNMAVEVDDLTAFYVDFYRTVPTDVTIELDTDGRVSTITSSADLSNVYTALFADDSPLDLGLSATELAQGRDAFEGTIWTIETRVTFELAEDLVVETAPATDDDRTEEWRQFLVQSGLLDN